MLAKDGMSTCERMMRQVAMLERLGIKTHTVEEENITLEEGRDTAGHAKLKIKNISSKMQRDDMMEIEQRLSILRLS